MEGLTSGIFLNRGAYIRGLYVEAKKKTFQNDQKH